MSNATGTAADAGWGVYARGDVDGGGFGSAAVWGEGVGECVVSVDEGGDGTESVADVNRTSRLMILILSVFLLFCFSFWF